MRRFSIRFAAILVLATVAAGCGGDSGPATYPVKGKVVYKGSGAPVTQGIVLFKSTTEPPVQASGDIRPDGTFELDSNLGKPGTVAGEHRILIQPPVLEPGQKGVHKRFTSYDTSNLKATVAAKGDNFVTLEVE